VLSSPLLGIRRRASALAPQYAHAGRRGSHQRPLWVGFGRHRRRQTDNTPLALLGGEPPSMKVLDSPVVVENLPSAGGMTDAAALRFAKSAQGWLHDKAF